mgnify:FL=1
MKMKKTLVGLITFALLGCSVVLGSCGQNVTEKIIETNETYSFVNPPYSLATMDEDVTIDGKFDEPCWSEARGRRWLHAKKISGTNTADVGVTTYFGNNGVYFAFSVSESSPISFNPVRSANYNSGIEFYFAFSDASTWLDGLYEIDVTAGEQFNIRKYATGGYRFYGYNRESAPVMAVVRNGDIYAGTCTAYDIELFLPYSMFGRTTKPTSIYLNPTHIAPTDPKTQNREWYNLGQNQISFYGWEKTNQAYTFDIGGFVSDKLILEASGGVVSEEWGYDFVVAGDRVNLFLTPEDGKKLKVFTVNGIDRLSEVKDSVYSFTHDGMGQVLVHAEFD